MKILLILPIIYNPFGGFWYRDLGLITRSLRDKGHDAWLVCLKGSENSITNEPVLTVSLEDLESPKWWKQQSPDGAILGLWRATRYEKIRAAARTSTCRLVEKADSDGVISPIVWPSEYFNMTHTMARDSGKRLIRTMAPVIALLRTVVLWLFPDILDRKIAIGLSRLPVLAAESPIAVERLIRFMRNFTLTSPKISCISHPVDLSELDTNSQPERTNRIVAVGRWNAYQKNFPLLIQVMNEFLENHPDWEAEIVGKLPQDIDSYTHSISVDTLKRLKLSGPVPHNQLGKILKSSKIFLISSRHESFNIAAAEALCCGCSVVGPIDIASVSWFTSHSSGTASSRNSHYHLLDALSAESTAWIEQKRDPIQIAEFWRLNSGVGPVTDQLIDLLLKAA